MYVIQNLDLSACASEQTVCTAKTVRYASICSTKFILKSTLKAVARILVDYCEICTAGIALRLSMQDKYLDKIGKPTQRVGLL